MTDVIAAPQRGKSETAFRTISEVAEELDVAQHVLRFWESKFVQVRPLKRGGGRRYYRPDDVRLLKEIRTLLYDQGYTIKGAQKLLRDRRVKPAAVPPEAPDAGFGPDAAAQDDDPSPASLDAADPPPRAEAAPDRARLLALRRGLAEARDLLRALDGEPHGGTTTIDPTDIA